MQLLTPFVIALLLCACSANQAPLASNPRSVTAELSDYPLEFYTDRLAAGLLQNMPKVDFANKLGPIVAVTSFLPIEKLSLNETDADEVQLANQLAESMLTYAVNHGVNAVDFRLRKQVLLLPNHEQALTRNLDGIKLHSSADAVLTGTYLIKEDGLMVNARLIDVQSNKVLSAVTDYIPINVFWSDQQVMKRGNHLYRHSVTGEKK